MKKYQKAICLLVIVVLSVIVLIGCPVMIRVAKVNNAKQMIEAIENQDYDTLHTLCSKPLSDIDCASEYSVLLSTICEIHAYTPLETAIHCNDVTAVQILLDAGADPNKNGQLRISTNQIYPLEHGIAIGNSQIVEQLILHGADVNQSAQDGLDKMIRFSVRKESVSIEEFTEILDLLEAQGATILYNDLLFCAAIAADAEVMSYLVQQKQADIHATDSQGRTVLHLCIISGMVNPKEKPETVMFCLKQGVDVHALDAQSKTAHDYAVERGYDELSALIKAAESQPGE